LLVGYTVEILPYNIRAKGMTVVFLMVDIALFFNQYINPIALDAIGWKYYILQVLTVSCYGITANSDISYCVWLGVELVVVYFFYVETRNTPLEEIAKHFDGDQALLGGGAASPTGLTLASEMGLDGTVTHATDEKKHTGVEVDHVQ
jgi:hypothetical protein